MIIFISPKLLFYTLFFSIITFLVLSIPTAVIKTIFFTRMTPVYSYDYVFLVINSLLIGFYYALTKTSNNSQVCKVEKKSLFGQALAMFGIACPICNKLLVFLLGIPFLLTFLEPVRPFISLASMFILLWLIYKKLQISSILVTK